MFHCKVRKKTQKYTKVRKSTQKYAKVRKSTQKYAKVRKSTQKYAESFLNGNFESYFWAKKLFFAKRREKSFCAPIFQIVIMLIYCFLSGYKMYRQLNMTCNWDS